MRIKFIEKRECLRLTWFSKVLILFFVVLIGYWIVTRFPLFLSENNPVNGEYLVLDGLMPDYSIEEAIRIFQGQRYKAIITTGGNLTEGFYITNKKTMAELTASTFLKLGFDSTKLIVISGESALKDRTYTSGVMVKKWLSVNNIRNTKINVVSVSCHSRRSHILFQKALGKEIEVGVIAVKDRNYDIHKWWETSYGFRTVVSEMIAYCYVKLFFRPFPEGG